MKKQYTVAQNLRLHRQHHDIGATVTMEESDAEELIGSGVLEEVTQAAPAPVKQTTTPPASVIDVLDKTVTEKPVTTTPKARAKRTPKAAKPKATKGSKAT